MQSVPFSQCQRATLVDKAASTGAGRGQVKRTEAHIEPSSIVDQAPLEAVKGGPPELEKSKGYNYKHSRQI